MASAGNASLNMPHFRYHSIVAPWLSTAVTSPKAEEHGAKMTPRFPAMGSKPTGPPAPSRPTLFFCLGQKVPNNKKHPASRFTFFLNNF